MPHTVWCVGREANRGGRSMDVSSCGPYGFENPAGSINTKNGANPFHRKSKGSSAMIISRGLAGPNHERNSNRGNREAG